MRTLWIGFMTVLICVACFAPVASADWFEEEDHEEHRMRPGGEHDQEDDTPYKELFELISKVAVVLGAISLSWYLMKRKMKSTVPAVKKMGKWFYKLHEITGWLAVILVAAHGIYFALTKWNDDETLTGLFAGGLMLILALWGLILRGKRTTQNRNIHLILALVWVVLIILHAEDVIPLLILVCGGSWAVVWGLERKLLKISGNE